MATSTPFKFPSKGLYNVKAQELKRTQAEGTATPATPNSSSKDSPERVPVPAEREKVVVSGNGHSAEIIDHGEHSSQFFRYLVHCSCAWQSRQHNLEDSVRAAEMHIHTRARKEAFR